jgi:serine/threonine protein kinase
MTEEDKEALQIEADILEEMNHPNIVTLKEAISTDRFMYLVLRYYFSFQRLRCFAGDGENGGWRIIRPHCGERPFF